MREYKSSNTPTHLSDSYDIRELENLARHDKTHYNKLLDSFIRTLEESVRELEEAIKSHNFGLVDHISHRMKPAAKYFKMERTLERLHRIDEILKQKSHDELEDVIPSTCYLINNTIEQLKNERK